MNSWPVRHLYRLPIFWRIQVVGWSCFMIYGFLTRSSFWGNYAMGAAMTLLLDPLAMLLSCGLREIYTRLHLRSGFNIRTVSGIIFFSILAAGVELAIAHHGGTLIAQALGFKLGSPKFMARLTFFATTFVGWSIMYVWLKAEFQAQQHLEKVREATAAAQRVELQMLRLQFSPHFMFNALNNIATQIPTQPDTALEMTYDLADFLRYSLAHHTDLIVPLSHEVEAMTTYLSIEQRRFGDRLQVQMEAQPEALQAQVPSLLLQPLVENAVKHGLNTSTPPWDLDVRIAREDTSLHIHVRNTGHLADDWRTKADSGTGIANLRRRLELHFPSRHHFSLRQDGDQVSSEIVLCGEPCQV